MYPRLRTQLSCLQALATMTYLTIYLITSHPKYSIYQLVMEGCLDGVSDTR